MTGLNRKIGSNSLQMVFARLTMILILAACSLVLRAAESLVADTVGFVRVSYLVVGVGESMYSACGHAALRLECPQHKLDVCFSYLAPVSDSWIWDAIVTAQSQEVIGVNTIDYFKEIQNEGRSIIAYELNLTDAQKRRLWQLMDQANQSRQQLPLDYINHGCALALLNDINRCLANEQLNLQSSPISEGYSRRDIIAQTLADRPWTAFWFSFILGPKVDSPASSWAMAMTPAAMATALENSHIVTKIPQRSLAETTPQVNADRPAVMGKTELLSAQSQPSAFPIAPEWVALGWLVANIVLAIVRNFGIKPKGIGMAIDWLNLALCACLMAMVMVILLRCQLYGAEWTWLVLLYNPLPIAAWCCRRSHIWLLRLSSTYWICVIAFIAITLPNISRQAALWLPHLLLGASLAIWLLGLSTPAPTRPHLRDKIKNVTS